MRERLENDPAIQAIKAQVDLVAPTDAIAMDILYDLSLQLAPKKCACVDAPKHRFAGDRNYLCGGCGDINSFTSGTLLHKVTLFKAYLTAFLIREAGLLISALAFSRLTDVHFGTALSIQKKLSLAMVHQMDDASPLTTARPLQEIIARRSCETPARMHPFAEEEEIERMNADLDSEIQTTDDVHLNLEVANSRESCEPVDAVESFGNKVASGKDPFETAIEIIGALLSKVPITAEKLSIQTSISFGMVNGALTMLEMNGQATELPGGRFISAGSVTGSSDLTEEELAFTARTKLAVEAAISSVKSVFHRVSRKAVQLYLAAVWSSQDRERWGSGSVLYLCFNHPPIRYQDLLNYVSPPQMKIMHTV